MDFYRCYFLDAEDRIRAAEDFEADAPGEAIDLALAMLRRRSQHRAIELWQGARRVYKGGPTEVTSALRHSSGSL